ncbi:O-antigen polymerase [Bordetella genomosp. 1]|uniref:O-antigen polymerase n=1 Tax=Bordetella genomosp. 1 TaxID=1395607 RepID=A0A261RU27_9BORD|nr:O-antigen ligase family protein [Bordetella genomosp. 1]OZI28162.1 O-antigen polymerase [Bordetella genomosp. 1]
MLNRLSAWLLIGSVGLLPAMLLSTYSGGSAAFYLAIIASALMIASAPRRHDVSLPQLLKPYWAVLIAFAMPMAAVAVSATLNASWGSTDVEKSLRLAVGVPIMLAAMLYCPPAQLKQTLWGMMLAAWISTITVLSLIYPNLLNRPDTKQYNAVSYGNLTLLITAIIAYALPLRLTRFERTEKVLKIAAVVVGFVGFILTQTRSGWLAIPLFLGLGIALHGRIRHPLRAFAVLVGLVVAVLLIGSANPLLRDRTVLVYTQSHECLNENPTADTSICVRLQLWRSALGMIASDPLTGFGGSRGFQQRMGQLGAEGKVSPYVASGFGEPHNDMLEVLASYGILGGIGLLLVYGVPARIFLRRMRRDHGAAIRATATMGAATCLGFAVFGLTELMFRGMRTVGFYAVLVGLFLVLSDPRLVSPRKKEGADAG